MLKKWRSYCALVRAEYRNRRGIRILTGAIRGQAVQLLYLSCVFGAVHAYPTCEALNIMHRLRCELGKELR